MREVATIADLRAALDAERGGGRARRLRAHDGVPARRPRLADAPRPGPRRDVVAASHLREPAAVRGGRGPRRLPPRPRPRPVALRRPAGVDVLFTPDVDEMYPAPVLTTVSRRRAHRDAGGGVPAHPLRRRHHGRRQAVLHRRAVPRLLRREGLPAARGRPAHGRRPVAAGRGGRLPDRARARRPGDVEPQRLPRAPTSGRPRRSLYRALRAGAAAIAAGERDPAAVRDLMAAIIAAEPLAGLDYAEVVDADTFDGPGSHSPANRPAARRGTFGPGPPHRQRGAGDRVPHGDPRRQGGARPPCAVA